MLQICDRYLSYNCDRYLPHNCDRYLSHNCDRYVMGPNSYMLQICDRYLSHNCDRYLSHNCDRYLSNICDRYVMGPNSYMLQICDRYFRTYILQIFYRSVTYICHISVSLVRVCRKKPRSSGRTCTALSHGCDASALYFSEQLRFSYFAN